MGRGHNFEAEVTSLFPFQTPEDPSSREIICCHGHQADPPNTAANLHINNAVQCLTSPHAVENPTSSIQAAAKLCMWLILISIKLYSIAASESGNVGILSF